jgi:hypothetical protein
VPKLTCMTEGVVFRLAADDGGRLSKGLKSSLAGVAETSVPCSQRRSSHEGAGA